MSKKRKVLVISDSYNVYTGFANVARHVSNSFHDSGNYEIAYVCWFHAPLNPIKPPFTYYTTLKGHESCCKRPLSIMKHEPNKDPEYFQVNQGVLIPTQQGPECLGGRIDDQDKYAYKSLRPIITDFQPDIIWTLGDTWMTYHTQFMDLRTCYKWVSYTPVDGTPMPLMTEMGNQIINWPETILKADRPVAFCDFGRDAMISTGKTYDMDLNKIDVIYHGNDNKLFHPMKNKDELKKKIFNIESNVFLLGFFSRNQPRKAVHKTMEALSIGKKLGYWSGDTLKAYFHFPIKDVGWNVPGLIKHHELEDIVIVNKNLKVGTGPTDEEMNEYYNACDLMSMPSRGEGWGLTYSESMSAGVPTLMSAYSAHHDWAKGGAARINIVALDSEPVTNIDRAIVDTSDYCEKIKAFYDNIPMNDYESKFGVTTDYKGLSYPSNCETPVREYFSKKGREVCEEHLSWDKVCDQWNNILDAVDTSTNSKYPVFERPKLINLEDLVDKEKKDRVLYVMPGSFGDVFLSTAVVDGIKKKYPTKDIYFAVAPQFKSILEDNHNVYKVLDYSQIFDNTPVMNNLFDITFTPHFETQRSSNWTKNGHGVHLANTYAEHCGVDLGDLLIGINSFQKAPVEYCAIHVKTGQVPKDYNSYQRVVDRIDMEVIQIGGHEDPLLKNVTDMRGKKIQETAGIIDKAQFFIGGDSICAHIAGYTGTDRVLLYGSTFPNLTKPIGNGKEIIIEPDNRLGCDRPCHLLKCIKHQFGCISTIDPKIVIENIANTLDVKIKDEPIPTISGYTTLYNPNKYYPWRESIKSMLGFCDEVVIVDGKSTDGTWEELKEWKKTEPKLKIYKKKWRDDEPSMDGMQKAYGKALCTKEFCWQMDADEIVHEKDYDTIIKTVQEFPPNIDVLILPVLDLYGTDKTVRSDRGLYKWRIYRNTPDITHGIPKQLRQTNKDGKIFCDTNACDGCFPIDTKTGELTSKQASFMNPVTMNQLMNDPKAYSESMKTYFKNLPSIWHYSWHDLKRRMKVDLDFWDNQWKVLDSKDEVGPNRFFPDTSRDDITEELMTERAEFLKDKKLDESPMDLISIDWTDTPEIMKEYLNDNERK